MKTQVIGVNLEEEEKEEDQPTKNRRSRRYRVVVKCGGVGTEVVVNGCGLGKSYNVSRADHDHILTKTPTVDVVAQSSFKKSCDVSK